MNYIVWNLNLSLHLLFSSLILLISLLNVYIFADSSSVAYCIRISASQRHKTVWTIRERTFLAHIHFRDKPHGYYSGIWQCNDMYRICGLSSQHAGSCLWPYSPQQDQKQNSMDINSYIWLIEKANHIIHLIIVKLVKRNIYFYRCQ